MRIARSLPVLAALAAALSLAGCLGKDGAPGPTGPTGLPATGVHAQSFSYTIRDTDFVSSGLGSGLWYVDRSLPALTPAVDSSSVVLGYVRTPPNLTRALPWMSDNGAQQKYFSRIPGTVRFWDKDVRSPARRDPIGIWKIVIVPGSASARLAGVDTRDFRQVQRLFGLQE